MTRTWSFGLGAILLFAPFLHANTTIAFTLEIRIAGFTVESNGSATPACGYPCWSTPRVTGVHEINDGGAGTIASNPFDSVFSYSDTVSAGTQYEHCYRARLAATVPGEFGHSNAVGSSMACAPPQPGGPTIPPVENICEPEPGQTQCSPILINLRNGRYDLSGADDPVSFDIDADGSPNRITWTARGSAVAFLALDRNENLRIDDGSELFGDSTRLASGVRAANGFEALREFDTNGDGVVSILDDRWSSLMLWTDANHDAVSQPEELQSAALSAMTAIETSYHWSGRRDNHGNLFRYQGTATLGRVRRSIYDLYFRAIP